MNSSMPDLGFFNGDKPRGPGFPPKTEDYQQNILENLHNMSSHIMESTSRNAQMKNLSMNNLQKSEAFSQIEINKYLQSFNMFKLY